MTRPGTRTPGQPRTSSSCPGTAHRPGPPGGGTTLTFALGTPTAEGHARLRIVYYYRGAVVQSQLLEAEIGVSGRWRLVTDYTAAAELASAAAITARPRVAVVLNGDETGHEIYVRHREVADGAAGGNGQQAAAVVELPAAIGDRVRRFRQVLASEPIAPATSARSRRQLHESLQALAPLGWSLRRGVPGDQGGVLPARRRRRRGAACGPPGRREPQRAVGTALHDQHRLVLRPRVSVSTRSVRSSASGTVRARWSAGS